MTYLILVGVVYALAVMRLTRLINADTILDRPRAWLSTRLANARQSHVEAVARGFTDATILAYAKQERRFSTALYFVGCPWCVGMWLAFGTVWIPMWFHTNQVTRYVGIALAISHLVGVCARFADTEEIDYEDETVA